MTTPTSRPITPDDATPRCHRCGDATFTGYRWVARPVFPLPGSPSAEERWLCPACWRGAADEAASWAALGTAEYRRRLTAALARAYGVAPAWVPAV